MCLLASGSRGNSIHISNGASSILVDAGLSGVELERRMKSRNIDPRELGAILVTHEHGDHVQSVGVLSRRFDLPVYINRKTSKAACGLGVIEDLRHFECGASFQHEDLTIHPFSISHDAEDPAGFTIGVGDLKVGIATDLGVATSMVKVHLDRCALLVLEANHDPDMLINGPYPWPLKQRIKSRTGHLSNEDSGKLLKEILHDRLHHVVLAHLSEQNNTPEKALSVVGGALAGHAARLAVGVQDKATEIFHV